MNNGSCEFESHLGHQIVARAIQTALATNFFPQDYPSPKKLLFYQNLFCDKGNNLYPLSDMSSANGTLNPLSLK